MSNIFGPRRGRQKPPKRNRFDMSYQHLSTTDFGLIKPFFCKEVLGGDSFSDSPICAIRSHPIVFPINTRMRVYCHYFYVRNRVLWKDWESFIFKTKEGLTPPYLQLTPERAKKMISTGSLGDCLGVPSTIAGASIASSVAMNPRSTSFLLHGAAGNGVQESLQLARDNGTPLISDSDFPSVVYNDAKAFGYRFGVLHSPLNGDGYILRSDVFDFTLPTTSNEVFLIFTDLNNVPITAPMLCILQAREDDSGKFIEYEIDDSLPLGWYDLSNVCLNTSPDGYYVYFIQKITPTTRFNSYFPIPDTLIYEALPSSVSVRQNVSDVIDSTDDSVISLNKFVGENPLIPLSALPFRACEMISNYFYRNDQNNPYILNGEAQYNTFIPTTDGGPDTNEYVLHHRNWEFDAYTSAVPSPQFGAAPLVGVTYSGGREAELSFQGTNSDGETQNYQVKVGLADDGVIQSVIDFDKGVPSGNLRQLIDLTSVGISINDLRNVNSYQRFKENCLRRSLRYRDQMLSHLGVAVDYPDIDVPQFIGGFSGDLVVTPVTNMAESSEMMLGDVAGKIEAVIKSNHRITCYCPEHGFIIGMYSIVPVPTYSQLLPKMFTRYDAFDYFQSEFGKIGYVPIFHRELFPLQSPDPDKVFGYQRAWYDYMSSPDEVHGDFRTSLDDFVLYRQFSDEPTLNEDFTTIKSDSLNNIFAVDKVDEKYKNSEKFMVQFYHDCTFKRPIPKYGVPSLE